MMCTFVRGLLVANLSFFLIGCGGGESNTAASATGPVTHANVAVATMMPSPTIREAAGTVRSVTTSAIQSKILGHVKTVHVRAGDVVDAGALLAEIDSRDAEAAFKAAESGLTAAQRALDERARGIEAKRSAIQAAEAQRDLARTTFDRQSELFAKKAISKQVLDEAEAATKSADAEARMRAEELDAYEANRAQAMAVVDQAQAMLDAAKTGQSYTRVTAPFAGIVASKSVDVGDLASPGMTLFSLEDRHSYRLETNVDESTAANVRANDIVEVSVDGISSGPLQGTVIEIVPAADPASRTSIVKLALPPNGALRSGQFGRARFSFGESSSISVPRSALVVRGQLEGVFEVDTNGIAHLRLIKTGKSVDDRVEVLSGLSEGDRYITEATPEVVDGARIEAQ